MQPDGWGEMQLRTWILLTDIVYNIEGNTGEEVRLWFVSSSGQNAPKLLYLATPPGYILFHWACLISVSTYLINGNRGA